MKNYKLRNLIIFLVIPLILITFITSSFFMHTKNHVKIAFLGDSITFLGWHEPSGYIRQFVSKAKLYGIEISVIPAGIPGNTTLDMINRMKRDVIEQKPEIVFIMGGINNVIRNPWDKETFQKNMEDMVNLSIKNNIKPILLTITVDSENLNYSKNDVVDEYNRYLLTLAKQKKIQIIDVNTPLKKEIRKQKGAFNIVTDDGIHLNKKGNTIVADKIVRDFVWKFYLKHN